VRRGRIQIQESSVDHHKQSWISYLDEGNTKNFMKLYIRILSCSLSYSYIVLLRPLLPCLHIPWRFINQLELWSAGRRLSFYPLAQASMSSSSLASSFSTIIHLRIHILAYDIWNCGWCQIMRTHEMLPSDFVLVPIHFCDDHVYESIWSYILWTRLWCFMWWIWH